MQHCMQQEVEEKAVGRSMAVTAGDVRAAAERIRAHVAHPAAAPLPARALAAVERVARAAGVDLDRCEVYLKNEGEQPGGAFKLRGAMNAVALAAAVGARTVVTHSSGNHAQALARAAAAFGVAASIVVPEDAPPVKLAAVRAALPAGSRMTLVPRAERELRYREALADAGGAAEGGAGGGGAGGGGAGNGDTGAGSASVDEKSAAGLAGVASAVGIPPYNDVNVIAGQGTIGLEILSQLSPLDLILCPIGGGGLISGICASLSDDPAAPAVIGVEPAAADDAARSRSAGRLLPNPALPRTIADGLMTNLGDLTWPFVRDRVADVVTVDEPDILRATALLAPCAEPSGAAPLAALLTPRFWRAVFLPRFQARMQAGTGSHAKIRICIVVTGKNADWEKLRPLLPDLADRYKDLKVGERQASEATKASEVPSP